MVRLIPAKVFLKDPVDTWGNERTMGLSELAVRINAPSMMYDRRGDVIFWNSFESPTDKFYTGGSDVVRSMDTSRRGNFSLKCTTGTSQNDAAGAHYYLTDFHSDTTIGVQTSFASEDTDYDMIIYVEYYSGTTLYSGKLRYVYSTGELHYWAAAGWVVFASAANQYNKALKNWVTIKLVVDLDKQKYVRALAFGSEYDLSAHDMVVSADTTAKHLYVCPSFRKLDVAATARIGYLDDVIITENEPL